MLSCAGAAALLLCCHQRTSQPVKAPGAGYWASIVRPLPVTPRGHTVAVSCHNCYQSLPATATNLPATLQKIASAQQAGADIIELDVKEDGGRWYVDHDDDGSRDGPLLDDVLADPDLRSGNQLLYVELKETRPTRRSVRALLDALTKLEYARPGRDLVLRSFHQRIQNLRIAKHWLTCARYATHAPHIRLQVLFQKREVKDLQAARALMREAHEAGLQGVEFQYQSARIEQLLHEAHEQGFGTNVWTFRRHGGTRQCARFRDAADSLTTDSPPGKCRSAVMAGTTSLARAR